jgi:hypothetical protein
MNGEEAPKKKKTWLWVILGVFVFFVMIAVGGIIVAVSMFRNSMSVNEFSEAEAMQQFEAVRNRYPGQQPLIQLVDGQPQYVADRASQGESTKPLSTVHIIAYDGDEGKVVTFSLPFWLLRMKSGPIRISAYQQGWDDHGVSFRVEDIEKYGPGIIVDATRPNEGRVLVWAE